jgi:hypothetical protein
VLPVVPIEPDHAHRAVLGVERAQDVGRAVAAPVVHEDDFVRLTELLERLGEAVVEVAEAPRLVEERDDDRERGAGFGAHRSTSRTSRQSLWPPKPNELEMAARIRPVRGTFGT